MSSRFQEASKKQLLQGIPSGIPENIQYEVIMGSNAYAVEEENSDFDIYGFFIPDKIKVFPHLDGYLYGYDAPPPIVDTVERHAVMMNDKEHGFSLHSISKYFKLITGCNPNMIDSLFVPVRCITYMTPIGQQVRDNRHMFLNKRAWHTYKGYAYRQLTNSSAKVPKENSKRYENYVKFGYDTKSAYNVVRMLNQVEQILEEGDLDLERSREQLKSIRRGEWTLEQIQNYFHKKESELETLYTRSKLTSTPDLVAIKNLLLNLLEQHFGSISSSIARPDRLRQALRDIEKVIEQACITD